MFSPPHPYPPVNAQTYRSAYSGGMVSDEKGKFHHFIRQPGPVHELNGYWRFNSFKDDQHAYRRGFATPEEILVAQDRGDASFDEIMLTWLPGRNDDYSGKATTGTPAAHLETIYNERQILGRSMSLRGCVPFYLLANNNALQAYRTQRYSVHDGVKSCLSAPSHTILLSSSLKTVNTSPNHMANDPDSQHKQEASLLGQLPSSASIASQKLQVLPESGLTLEIGAPTRFITLSQDMDGTAQSTKKVPKTKASTVLRRGINPKELTAETRLSTKLPSDQAQETTKPSTSQHLLQRSTLPPMQGLRGSDWIVQSPGSFTPTYRHVSYYGNPFDQSQYQQQPGPPMSGGNSKFANRLAPPVASLVRTGSPKTPVITLSDSLRSAQSQNRESGEFLSERNIQLPVNPVLLQTEIDHHNFSSDGRLRGGGNSANTGAPSSSEPTSVGDIDQTANFVSSDAMFDTQPLNQSQTLETLDKNLSTVEQIEISSPLSVQNNQDDDTLYQNTVQSAELIQSDSSSQNYNTNSTRRNDVGLYDNTHGAGSDMEGFTPESLTDSSKIFPVEKDSYTGILRLADGSSSLFTPPLTPNLEKILSDGTHGPYEEYFASLSFVEHVGSDEETPAVVDPFEMLPCMDCEQIGEHKWDCHIGHINPMTTVTILDYRNLADDVRRFDPGPFIGENEYVGPAEVHEPESEDSSSKIKGMAEVIRNEDSFKNDSELQMLPDQLMILLWALKTSVNIEVIQQ